MKTLSYKLFLLLSLLYVACSPQIRMEEKSIDSHVTFIIDNPSEKRMFIWREETFTDLDSLEFSSKKQLDTLKIPTPPWTIFYISHPEISSSKLVAAQGDTIHISVESAKIDISHPQKSTENLNAWVNSIVHNYPRSAKSDSLLQIKQIIIPIDSNRQYKFNQAKEMKIGFALKHENLDDTLLVKEYLTGLNEKYEEEVSEVLQLSTSENTALIDLLVYMLRNNHLSDINTIKSFYPNLNIEEFYDLEKIEKSLLENPFARKLLQAELALHASGNTHSSRNSPRGRSRFDYGFAFDSLPKTWSDSIQKYARYIAIEMMVDQEDPFTEIEKRYQIFNEIYPHDRFTKILESRYLFDLEKYRNLTNHLQLLNKDRNLTSLDSVLAMNFGNVIFVDFWASWCAPCRAAMPSSHKLSSDYKEKNLTIIYLSIDAKYDEWEDATVAEALNRKEHNYLVVNHHNANFLKQIELNTIPRYLLYDDSGQLVHQNAPGPDSPELRRLINLYLDRQ